MDSSSANWIKCNIDDIFGSSIGDATYGDIFRGLKSSFASCFTAHFGQSSSLAAEQDSLLIFRTIITTELAHRELDIIFGWKLTSLLYYKLSPYMVV